jgi:hypothetical protein
LRRILVLSERSGNEYLGRETETRGSFRESKKVSLLARTPTTEKAGKIQYGKTTW